MNDDVSVFHVGKLLCFVRISCTVDCVTSSLLEMTLTDTGGDVLTLMLGYRRLRIYKLQEGWLLPTERESAG